MTQRPGSHSLTHTLIHQIYRQMLAFSYCFLMYVRYSSEAVVTVLTSVQPFYLCKRAFRRRLRKSPRLPERFITTLDSSRIPLFPSTLYEIRLHSCIVFPLLHSMNENANAESSPHLSRHYLCQLHASVSEPSSIAVSYYYCPGPSNKGWRLDHAVVSVTVYEISLRTF